MKARIISLAGCVAALTAASALLVATAASAAKPVTSSKLYSLVLDPASIAAGATTTITATYENLTGQQQLGSSDLTLAGEPLGSFTVESAEIVDGPSGATVRLEGNVVKLRNLSTPPGGSLKVSMQVTTSCAGGTGTWTAVTKQANDFNGPPGNDLTLDESRSSMTTEADGNCRLRFSKQPNDVQVGSTITSEAGDPSGPPVEVEVLDAFGNKIEQEISVTVGLDKRPDGATLSGTKTVPSTNGIAKFDTLSVDAVGDYTLLATSPNASSDTSDVFRAHLTLVRCINNVLCTATASTGGTVPGSNRRYTNTVDVNALPNEDGTVANDGGTIALDYNQGKRSPSCQSYDPVSPDYEVVVGPKRELTVKSTIAKAVLDARHRSATSLNTCLIAPYQFRVALGGGNAGLARPIGDFDGDGIQDFEGLLLQCHPVAEDPPCQVSAGSENGNGVVVYKLPPDPNDPLGRH